MSNRRGFTLIELLIVVTILGILASVIVPAAQTNETQTLEATGRSVVTDLRYARSLAIEYSTQFTVRFDANDSAYEVLHTGTGPSPPLRDPLGTPTAENTSYRVALNPQLGGLSRGPRFRIAGMFLRDSRTKVSDVTFGPTGGTGPGRNEDTILWIAKPSGNQTSYVQITVSWVTGFVWLSDPETLSGTLTAIQDGR